jgi:CBS domain containing-hemolysin-like protein
VSDVTIIIGLLAVLALVATNGLFVATEFAYVAVRRTRIEHLASQGHARARLLLGSLRKLDMYIAATQLGITMSSLGLGWVGEPALARLIEPALEDLAGDWAGTAAAHTIAVTLTFIFITALLIVFGELAPKNLALAQAERTALWVVAPMEVFARIFRPFIWLLNRMGLGVARLAGVRPVTGVESTLAPEELELVMEASARAGLLSTAELLLAQRGLEFGELQADQVMAPRRDVAAIDASSSMDEVLAITGEHPHRRYPVYEGDLDHIIGLLDTKDLMRVVREGGEDWRSLVGPVVAIPESVSLEVAVTEMRAQGATLVVLVDEHGGTSGILSGDDVLARLLGQWHAGTRQQAGERIRSLPNGNLLLDGLALVSDLEDVAEVAFRGAGEDFDTVSGFVMERLGRIPTVGERFEEAGYEFQVTAMDGRRVARVIARRGGSVGRR